MDELRIKDLKKTEELLERRFEEIKRLTDDLNKVTKKMKTDYLDERQMQVHTMRFNDIMVEFNEECELVLAICVVYEIRTLGECLSKPKRKRGWKEE